MNSLYLVIGALVALLVYVFAYSFGFLKGYEMAASRKSSYQTVKDFAEAWSKADPSKSEGGGK